MLSFWHDASPEARRVLASLMADMGIDRATGGPLGSLTLAASAVGGIVFGVVADRIGRTRALSLSILLYSIFTARLGDVAREASR